MGAAYLPPVDRLLTLGKGSFGDWPDYLGHGLLDEHVPELIRMATDPDLDSSDSHALWAPIHARRALGQLRAEEAVEPLLDRLSSADELDDWPFEELPLAFGMIGPPAVAALAAYLSDPSKGTWSRVSTIEGLRQVGIRHPDRRDEITALLARQLEECERQNESLNAFLIHNLVELGATDAAPVMARAFAAERVDLSVRGDWEDAQVELGLLDQRLTPRARRLWSFDSPSNAPRPLKKERSARDPAKAKRKAAKESRRRNRRRK